MDYFEILELEAVLTAEAQEDSLVEAVEEQRDYQEWLEDAQYEN